MHHMSSLLFLTHFCFRFLGTELLLNLLEEGMIPPLKNENTYLPYILKGQILFGGPDGGTML